MASEIQEPVQQKQEDTEFSFKELIVKSLNYLPLFIIFFIVSFAVAIVYIHFQTPLYNSSIKLILKDVNSKTNQTVSDQVLPQVFFNTRTNLANEMEVLKSQKLMEKVVLHQQLNTVYYSAGKVNTLELYTTDPNDGFVKFSGIKDSSRSYSVVIQVDEKGNVFLITGKNKSKIKNNEPIVTPNYTYVLNIPNPRQLRPEYKYMAIWVPTYSMAAGLAGSISVNPLSKEATILIISTVSQVPAKAQLILNSLVNEYNNYNIDQNNKIADNTISFIDDRLVVISNELNNVENGLKSFKETNNAIDLSAQGAQEISTAKGMQEKLNEQELQMNVADMVSQYVNNSKRSYELVPSNLGIEDLTLTGLVTSYNEGVLKRQQLLKTLGVQNLEVTTLENQLNDQRSKIIESINNIKAVYNNAYKSADAEYKTTLNDISTIPAKEKELLEIERQQGIKEKLYLFLLEKREESAVSRAAAIGKSESIDGASSSGPINIKNSNIYLMALFAGLGIPLLIVYLMDLFNDKLTTRQEIIKFTDAPIIGEISHFADQERKIVTSGKNRGILPEQFRILRTNLRYFLKKDQKSSTILITSTVPGEGKTFVSMNFAAVLATPGKRTIMIEFDMRRPKISEALGLPKETNDLAAFLSGTIEPQSIIRKVNSIENLYVITTSYVPPNPAELLLSDRLPVLFKYLKENFDYIVVDTPPLGIVSDAKVLADYADLSIYVIRQRFTQRKQVKMLDDIYQNKRLPNLTLVVNDVKAKGIRGYYGYGYAYTGSYGYDYSAGYGYNYGTRPEKTWFKKFRSFFR